MKRLKLCAFFWSRAAYKLLVRLPYLVLKWIYASIAWRVLWVATQIEKRLPKYRRLVRKMRDAASGDPKLN